MKTIVDAALAFSGETPISRVDSLYLPAHRRASSLDIMRAFVAPKLGVMVMNDVKYSRRLRVEIPALESSQIASARFRHQSKTR